MSKYVDADDFAKLMRDKAGDKKLQDEWVSGFQTGLLKAACMLETAPSADVVPIRHGTWKPDFCEYPSPYGTGTELHCDGVICSLCDCGVSTASAFCPHCGAKMDADSPDSPA